MYHVCSGSARAAFVGAILSLSPLVFPALSHAALLAPGGNIPTPVEPDPVGGTVIADSGVVNLTAATFTGTLVSQVISGDASNPFGGLTFIYSLTNDSTSPDPIERFTVSSFTSFLTDVSFQAGIGVGPSSTTRTGNGAVVGFNFTTPLSIDPGFPSLLMVVQTDANSYQPTQASVINGSVAMGNSFAPLNLNIPEPGTLAMFLGTGLLVLRRRRAL